MGQVIITEVDVTTGKVVDAHAAGMQLPEYPAGQVGQVDGGFLLSLIPDKKPRTWGEPDL